MKSKTLIILIISILAFSNCAKRRLNSTESKENPDEFITINTEQAERFIDVMDYIEKKSPNGFNTSKNINKDAIASNYNDIQLKCKIDSLLSLPIYRKFGKFMISWVGKKRYWGRKSYRMALLHLPYECIDMRAGLPNIWARFWVNDFDKNIKPLFSYISSNKKEFLINVLNKTAYYLPNGTDLKGKTQIFLCFDGNRGSFQWGDKIVMELTSFTNFDTTAFTNTLCHELHHRYYINWLEKNKPLKSKTSKQKILKNLQTSLIEEGVAQQFNFADKNEQSKSLYNNRQLIEELFTKLVSSIREIETQKNPSKWFRTQMNDEYDYAMAMLKKYSPNGYSTETISNRPSIIYYLSYHLYNSIYRAGGYQKLKYVIENPKELLTEYNNIYTEELLIPKIPEDVVALWKSNFYN